MVIKKIIFFIAFLCLNFINAFGQNSKADIFKYDEKQLDLEFAKLNELENYVKTHKAIPISELKTFYKRNEIPRYNEQKSNQMLFSFEINDMDWSSFACGFFCCPYGFFIIPIQDHITRKEKLSFWYGSIGYMVWYSALFYLYY